MQGSDKVGLCLVILMLLGPCAARADGERIRLDLIAGRSGVSADDPAVAGGLERPEGYDLGLRGVTLTVGLGSPLEAYVAAETDPWYEWGGFQEHLPGGPTAESWRSLQRELETLQAGLRWRLVDRGQWTLIPRAGVVRLELDDRSESTGYDPQPGWSRAYSSRASANGRLWGVSAELELGWRPVQHVEGMVRLGGRWATGPVERRETSVELISSPGRAAEQSEVSLERTRTESVGALVFDVGVAWDAPGWLVVGAGWQYRRWDLDQGSARTDSAYLRLGLRL